MKFGLLGPLRNPAPWSRPFPDLYRDTLEEIQFAEELGYESAWLTEHHFCQDGYLPSIFPALAAVAVSTSRIRIGPYVLLAPLYDPIRLAEDAAVVDIISNGRLEIAAGIGYRDEEFEGLGVPRKFRGSIQGEVIEVMLRAWEEGSFSFAGEHFSYSDLEVTPKPVQKPRPPVYLGGVSAPVLKRVARLPVAGVAGRPKKTDMPEFVEALHASGRDPGSVGYLPFLYMWVHRDAQRAREIATPFAEHVIGLYAEWMGTAGVTTLQRGVDEVTMGNPSDCIAAIEALLARGAEVPVPRLIIQPPLLGLDHRASMELIETFAAEVMPAFANR